MLHFLMRSAMGIVRPSVLPVAKESSVLSSKWQNQMPLVTISCCTEKHAQASLREVKSMLVFAAGETGEASAAFPHASKAGAGEALFCSHMPGLSTT